MLDPDNVYLCNGKCMREITSANGAEATHVRLVSGNGPSHVNFYGTLTTPCYYSNDGGTTMAPRQRIGVCMCFWVHGCLFAALGYSWGTYIVYYIHMFFSWWEIYYIQVPTHMRCASWFCTSTNAFGKIGSNATTAIARLGKTTRSCDLYIKFYTLPKY